MERDIDIQKELDIRFSYHAPIHGQPERYERIRSEAKALAETIVDLCPNSREHAVALTKLDETVMWANAAIARRT